MDCLSKAHDCSGCSEAGCYFGILEGGSTICVESKADLNGRFRFTLDPGPAIFCPKDPNFAAVAGSTTGYFLLGFVVCWLLVAIAVTAHYRAAICRLFPDSCFSFAEINPGIFSMDLVLQAFRRFRPTADPDIQMDTVIFSQNCPPENNSPPPSGEELVESEEEHPAIPLFLTPGYLLDIPDSPTPQRNPPINQIPQIRSNPPNANLNLQQPMSPTHSSPHLPISIPLFPIILFGNRRSPPPPVNISPDNSFHSASPPSPNPPAADISLNARAAGRLRQLDPKNYKE